MPRGTPRNPRVRGAAAAVPIPPAVIPNVVIPPAVPPPAPPAIAAAVLLPIVPIQPVAILPQIPILPILPIPQIIIPVVLAPQQDLLEDRVITSASNFITRYDQEFFNYMARSI